MNRHFPPLLRTNCHSVTFFALLFLLSVTGDSQAKEKVPISKRLRTELSFDLILPRTYSNPLSGQQWARIFEKMEVPVRVRQRKINDVAGVDQLIYGTVRRVKVIAQLDRGGNLVLPKRTFRLDESEKLKRWVEELQLYGAQGAPKGQPLWGMKKKEFDILLLSLTKKVEQDTSNLSVTEAIKAIQLPEQYPLKFTQSTRKHLTELEQAQQLHPMEHNLKEFAKGTALAMILRGYSLGFSPRRLPDESIELAIEPISEIDKAWPIGWDPASLGLQRLALSRKMYIAQVIELQNLPLTEMAPKIKTETGLDLFFDPQAIETSGIQMEKLAINFPRKRSSWSVCLKTVLSKLKLIQQLRVDENNRPFIWITKFAPKSRRKVSAP